MTDQSPTEVNINSVHVKHEIVTDASNASIDERDVKYKTDGI